MDSNPRVDSGDSRTSLAIVFHKNLYPLYNNSATNTNKSSNYLIDYFKTKKLGSADVNETYHILESLCKAFRKIIQHNSKENITTCISAFRSLLNLIPESQQKNFRDDMLNLIQLPLTTKVDWSSVIQTCKKILLDYFKVDTLEPLQTNWTEHTPQSSKFTNANRLDNTYTYTDPISGKSIKIHLGSIHSVKGQTHLATLVVETFWYQFNLKALIPCLYGNKISNPKQRNIHRLRCHYVALTRARGLVCLAIPKDSISEDTISLLEQYGWNVVRL